MKIQVKVIPRSSENKVSKENDMSYRVKITAPPVDGKANKQLIEVLSKEFGVAKSKVKIVKGETGRNKIIVIEE